MRESALDLLLQWLQKDTPRQAGQESQEKQERQEGQERQERQKDTQRQFNSFNRVTKMWLMEDRKWLKLFARALEMKLDNCLDTLIENKSRINESNCNRYR